MQNKPNFRKAKMNVSIFLQMSYEKFIPQAGQKTNPIQSQFKPNSNPIAERVKLMQSVYLQRIMKKNAVKGYEKTKPKQTQFKPNSNFNGVQIGAITPEKIGTAKDESPNLHISVFLLDILRLISYN